MEEKITYKKPVLSDYEYVRGIWEDPDTMEAVGGIYPTSKEYYTEWLEKVNKPDKKNCYYLIFIGKDCVGEVSFHRFNSTTKTADLNIKVKAKYRNMGIGKKALGFILKIFFRDWAGEEILDNVRKENRLGIIALKSFGFKEKPSDNEHPMLYMTKQDFVNIVGNG